MTDSCCNQPKSLSGIETHQIAIPSAYKISGCNQPKSLSGIETRVRRQWKAAQSHVAINLNPYQGLKLVQSVSNEVFSIVAINLNPYQGLKRSIASCLEVGSLDCCNQPKSLSGIETFAVSAPKRYIFGCNQPKSLSGIETQTQNLGNREAQVAINLNPYQGLKHRKLNFGKGLLELQST